MPQKFSKSESLLDWCSANGVSIDRRIRVVSDSAGSVYVQLKRSCSFDVGDSLSEIPKSAVLSVRSCVLFDSLKLDDIAGLTRLGQWDVNFGHGARLLLATALYTELMCKFLSRWAGYTDSLPQANEWSGTAFLWDAQRDEQGKSATEDIDSSYSEDANTAMRWLQGTAVERYLIDDYGQRLEETVCAFYYDVACPLFSRRWPDGPSQTQAQDDFPQTVGGARTCPEESWTLDGFRHAYALVCARAFVVDAYHGLAMVPVADAFNHTNENHVHLETEHDVCPECGSLAYCAHDDDDDQSTAQREELDGVSELNGRPRKRPRLSLESVREEDTPRDVENTCEMIANTRFTAPEDEDVEIFNTYGHLSNAALVARYGFALGDAEDGIPLSPSFVLLTLDVPTHRHDALMAAWHEILQDWDARGEQTWATSLRVALDIDLGDGEGDLGFGPDGSASHALWVLVALVTRERVHGDTIQNGEQVLDGRRSFVHADVVPALRALAARIVSLEALADEGEEEEDCSQNSSAPTKQTHAFRTSEHARHASDALDALLSALRRVCAVRWAGIAGGPAERARLATGGPNDGLNIANRNHDMTAASELVDDGKDVHELDVDPSHGSGAAGLLLDKLGNAPGWARTRASLVVALGEMSVLESAWAGWGEVLEAARSAA